MNYRKTNRFRHETPEEQAARLAAARRRNRIARIEAGMRVLDGELAAWCNAQDGSLTGQLATESPRTNTGANP